MFERTVFSCELHPALFREIHFIALNNLSNGQADGVIPESIDLMTLKKSKRFFGNNSLFIHPDDLSDIFRNITVGDYSYIQELYCSKYLRSPEIIWEIVSRVLLNSGRAGIPYEAIWAICAHLWKHRQQKIEVFKNFVPDEWVLVLTNLSIKVYIEGSPRLATIACVIDLHNDSLISFLVTDNFNLGQAISKALFAALIQCREISYDSYDGLLWKLPSSIICGVDLPSSIRIALEDIGISVRFGIPASTHTLESITNDWSKDLIGSTLTIHQIERFFNNYLFNVYGTNPEKITKAKNIKNRYKIGYKRPPEFAFPALRKLLPRFPASISGDGTIHYQGKDYHGEILQYWTNVNVNVSLPVNNDRYIWVYLGDEMLCDARLITKRKLASQSVAGGLIRDRGSM